MDPRLNPYSPGAGTPPPALAGRDDLLERASVALYRIARQMPTQSLILYGLRGVGKTVLLGRISLDGENEGLTPVEIEAPEGRSLPGILAPALRFALLRLNRKVAAKEALKVAMGALASFVRAAKLRFSDVEVGLEFDPLPGTADSGDLELDLIDLLQSIGRAASERNTAVVLVIDELQYVAENELAALITALHKANQRQLPITLVGAGLPQILGQMGRAKSYAERLFEFVPVGPLDPASADEALRVPAAVQGVEFEDSAIAEILDKTEGYPYFLQEWGKHAWNEAKTSPISRQDAERATELAIAELDASFFQVRFDRLTPAEKRYMRAMAELGPGPHRSKDIANVLGRAMSAVAPIRNRLITKGMIYSPSHGDTAFTVPLFDGFMRRIMPTLD